MRSGPDDALELITTVGAVAHGFAMLLLEGVFGAVQDALATIEARASAAAVVLPQPVP